MVTVTGHAHDDHADDHGDHAHDHHDEPPPPPEPPTPVWFTVTGAILFVVLGSIFFAKTADPKPAEDKPAKPAAAPVQVAQQPTVIPPPPPGGSAKHPVITPEMLERLRKARAAGSN